jgi:hypothetical protein
MKNNVCCFIHSTYLEIWKTEILERIVNYLKDTNFIEICDFIYINNIGETINEDYFNKISEKIIITNYSKSTDLFENFTLKQIHFFSKLNPNYKILYLHTKGVSHPKNHIFISNILDWVDFMLYSLVYNHLSCIELLETYDTVGVAYRDAIENPQHYSGNFWWANSTYINKLSILQLNTKHDAEWWILQKNPLFLNLYTSKKGHYENSFKPYEYIDYVSSNINFFKNNNKNGNNIINLKGNITGYGLTNQLNIIINCIFDIILNNKYNKRKQLLIIDKFNKNYNDTNHYCNIDEILNLNYINHYLQKYNIQLISKSNINFNITKAEYGLWGKKVIDVTSLIKEKCLINNELFVFNHDVFNKLLSQDPLKGIYKYIYIYYQINNENYVHVESEIENDNFKYYKHLVINFNNITNYPNIPSKENLNLYNKIIKNLKFLDNYYSQSIIPNLQYKKYSSIHLRNETDAITFWGKINKMDYTSFLEKINNVYISLIDKYLIPSNEEAIIVLTSEVENNIVLNYLTEKKYNVILLEKHNNLREINAIHDLLTSKIINNTYIGCHNPHTLTGSTFSNLYCHLLENNIKKILIDLDHITDEEYIS